MTAAAIATMANQVANAIMLVRDAVDALLAVAWAVAHDLDSNARQQPPQEVCVVVRIDPRGPEVRELYDA